MTSKPTQSDKESAQELRKRVKELLDLNKAFQEYIEYLMKFTPEYIVGRKSNHGTQERENLLEKYQLRAYVPNNKETYHQSAHTELWDALFADKAIIEALQVQVCEQGFTIANQRQDLCEGAAIIRQQGEEIEAFEETFRKNRRNEVALHKLFIFAQAVRNGADHNWQLTAAELIEEVEALSLTLDNVEVE